MKAITETKTVKVMDITKTFKANENVTLLEVVETLKTSDIGKVMWNRFHSFATNVMSMMPEDDKILDEKIYKFLEMDWETAVSQAIAFEDTLKEVYGEDMWNHMLVSTYIFYTNEITEYHASVAELNKMAYEMIDSIMDMYQRHIENLLNAA